MSRNVSLSTVALGTSAFTALAAAPGIAGDWTLHNPTASVPVALSTDGGATAFTLAPGGSIALPGVDLFGMSAKALPGAGVVEWTEPFDRGTLGLAVTLSSGIRAVTANSGTTNALEPSSTYGLNRIGLVSLSTGGSSASGRSALVANSSSNAVLTLGNGEVVVEQDVYLPALSSDTQAFTVAFGLTESAGAAATAPNCVICTYTHNDLPLSGPSGCWCIDATDNNSPSFGPTSTGVAVAAATWYRLRLTVNAAGTSATLTVLNGDTGATLGSATVTTNIPTASARAVGYMLGIFKSVGTGASQVVTDSARFRWTPSNPVPAGEAGQLSLCGIFGGIVPQGLPGGHR